MKIVVPQSQAFGNREVTDYSPESCFSVITVEHKGEKIDWAAKDYERGNDREGEVVFRHINQFWEWLPEERQDRIWDNYVKIRHIFDTIYDEIKMKNALVVAVADLYKEMPLEDFSFWIGLKSDIRIPPGIKSEYSYDDEPERTYLTEHYYGLILMSLVLRPIIPIWSEFIGRTRGFSGNNYKEYQAMGLLINTEIYHHPAMDKLRTYVEFTTSVNLESRSESMSVAAILSGLGSSTLPEWLLSLALVRRVAVGDLNADSDKGTIIANVYRYISNNIISLDKRFKGAVKKKEVANGDDEDNASVIEGYKVKEEQNGGDLVSLSVFTEHMDDIIERLQPDLDRRMFDQCLNNVRQWETKDIKRHQIVLIQWLIHPIISARGIEQLNKQALLRVLAICQAVMWHRGFPDIAKLYTAIPVVRTDPLYAGSFESRSLIPKDLMEVLVKMFPYYPQLKNRQQGDRKSNPVAKAIDLFCQEYVKDEWQLLGPPELTNGMDNFFIPYDIKIQLARFFIDREKRLTSHAHQ